MVLVEYSESDSESDIENVVVSLKASPSPDGEPAKKRKRADEVGDRRTSKLPPLPSVFHSLYATNVRTSTSDDPSLHGGRKRHVPHLEGNWPTHVYVEWYPSKTELKALQHLIATTRGDGPPATTNSRDAVKEIHSFLHSELGAQLPLHISLSAPIILQTHQRADFEESVEKLVHTRSLIPFQVTCTGLDWVPNHDKTRFFLVMRLSRPEHDELNRLLQISNGCAAQLGLDLLYEEPEQIALSKGRERNVRGEAVAPADHSGIFHISIAWQLGEPSGEGKRMVAGIDLGQIEDIIIEFNTLKIKIGNSVKDIHLGERN